MSSGVRGRRYIALSLLLAVCLQLMPLSDGLMHWRPMLPIIAVSYWAYILPSHFGSLLAFFYGLAVEAILGMPTLQLALPGAISVLVVQHVVMKLRSYSMLQQSLYIACLMLIVNLLVYPLGHLSFSFDTLKPLLRGFVVTIGVWCLLSAWLKPLSMRYVSANER